MHFLQILKLFLQILKLFLQILRAEMTLGVTHPSRYTLSRALLERKTEGAVTPVAAFAGQLLGGNGFLGSGSLPIETHEVVDAKIVDISIVSDALTGEILAKIETVGTNSLSQLDKGQVVLQIELGGHAVLFQQLFDIGGNDQ